MAKNTVSSTRVSILISLLALAIAGCGSSPAGPSNPAGTPAFSAVTAAAATSTTETITWTTDQMTDSLVEYGPTTAYGSSTVLGTAMVYGHTQGLSGLTPGTLYHFRAKSKNGAGLAGASADGTFTSPASGTPAISLVTGSAVTGTTATVSWTTDQPGDSQVEYGLTAAYGSSTTLAAAMLATHSQGLSGLTPGTLYHFRVKSKSAEGLTGTSADGTFTTPVSVVARLVVNLGSAGTFAILSKAGVTDVPASAIVGDVGSSPITGAAILLTCAEVTGRILSVDAAGPLPCRLTDPVSLTAAIGDMSIAYDDAAARVTPDFTELGAGEIGGRTLAQGLYKWGTNVSISTSVTLSGGPNDVWIFQIAGSLNQASATQITLSGGAQAKNVFWQVGTNATIGTTAHFEGILLAKTQISMNTGASITGRLFAQTAIALQQNAVTRPQ